MAEVTGIERTWDIFCEHDSVDVCRRGLVKYDQGSRLYEIFSFGQMFRVSQKERRVISHSKDGKLLLGFGEYFYDLAVLWYLIDVKEIGLTGKFVKPSEMKGGQIFVKGTHVLPLESLAEKYDGNNELLLKQAKRFGGEITSLGDTSVRLMPFPRVPVEIVFWFGDEEFPASAQLLFDSSCAEHLATDVVWAIATVCCLVLLEGD